MNSNKTLRFWLWGNLSILKPCRLVLYIQIKFVRIYETYGNISWSVNEIQVAGTILLSNNTQLIHISIFY